MMADVQALRLEKLKREKRKRDAAKVDRDLVGPDSLISAKTDPNNALDAHALGAAKAATFGHADVGAGVGAAAGKGLQALRDTGSPIEAGKAAIEGYGEGRDEHRALEQEGMQKSPLATLTGMGAGMALTGPLVGGVGNPSLGSQVARGVGTGALGAVGYGDADSIGGDLANAYVGATLGGLVPIVAGPMAEGLAPFASKVAAPLSAGASKLKDLLGGGAGKIAAAGEALPLPARAALGVSSGGASETLIRGSKAVAGELNPLPPTARGASIQKQLAASDGPAVDDALRARLLDTPDDMRAATRAIDEAASAPPVDPRTIAPPRGPSPTESLPPEVTPPRRVSPVPVLDDAAENAGAAPSIQTGDLDAKMAEIQSMIRARDAGAGTPAVARPADSGLIDMFDDAMPQTPAAQRAATQSVEEGMTPPWLRAMREERAQDWGTRPPPVDVPSPQVPPPDPSLVDHYIKLGYSRDEALALAYRAMARMHSPPQAPEGAVGRQRSAVGFDDKSPGPAPIATPKGRNKSSKPF